MGSPSTVHFTSDLDAGERDAIILALTSHSSALLIDDIAGREEARGFGLRVVGTLGVLKDAHEHGLLDFHEAVERLRRTSYRIAPDILDAILKSI